MHGTLSLPQLEDVETRCRSAWNELGFAHRFQHVLVNHDGEDSDHWHRHGMLLGEARRTVTSLVALLDGREEDALTEQWPADLIAAES